MNRVAPVERIRGIFSIPVTRLNIFSKQPDGVSPHAEHEHSKDRGGDNTAGEEGDVLLTLRFQRINNYDFFFNFIS